MSRNRSCPAALRGASAGGAATVAAGSSSPVRVSSRRIASGDWAAGSFMAATWRSTRSGPAERCGTARPSNSRPLNSLEAQKTSFCPDRFTDSRPHAVRCVRRRCAGARPTRALPQPGPARHGPAGRPLNSGRLLAQCQAAFHRGHGRRSTAVPGPRGRPSGPAALGVLAFRFRSPPHSHAGLRCTGAGERK